MFIPNPSGSARPVPAGWGDDELSKFLQHVHGNQFGTFVRKRAWYSRLAFIDGCFHRVATNITNPKNLVATALFYRSHSAYRAACGTAMAGQVNETFLLTRSCLEHAAYALRMDANSGHDVLWLNRNQSEADKWASINAFAMKKLRESNGA